MIAIKENALGSGNGSDGYMQLDIEYIHPHHYSVSSDDAPGCVGLGRTQDEAVANFHRAHKSNTLGD